MVCSYLLGFLFELLNGPLVDSTALVDQMTGGRRLAGIDVANHHDVDVNLLRAAHLDSSSWYVRLEKGLNEQVMDIWKTSQKTSVKYWLRKNSYVKNFT